MDFKSKASIIVIATISAVEAALIAHDVPGFEAAVLNAAQSGAEAAKSAEGLMLIERSVTRAPDGSLKAELVYAKVEATTSVDASQGANQSASKAPENAPPTASPPLGLHVPGAASTGA